MQISVTGRHMDVTDAIREYAEEKIGRVAKTHFRDDMQVKVVLHVAKNPARKNRDIAEVTARMKGMTVRAEEAAVDMYAAIDLVSEKLERQMRKYKTKLLSRRSDTSKVVVRTAPGEEIPLPLAEDDAGKVVRVKAVKPQPLATDDAILQMELLGHDFFVFRDVESNAVSVLYRRHNGDYGVIETED
ncbi:MAG: ribosome-associated translation inhibitor RaiA [Coriobacteriia bacterium]|nr:ribosome-associated translation inhibitor RaiA [Coriobacteriia bacterium]